MAKAQTHTRRIRWGRLMAYLILILGAVAVLYPLFYILMNSVKPGREILHSPTSLPSQIVMDGYRLMWEQLNMPRLFANSLFLALSVTLLNLLLDGLAAYALAKIPFPGREAIFAFMLGTMMIPGILFLIPTYVILYRLEWVPSFKALIIPGAVSVFSIFLLRQFMKQIPDELVEAARLDGASEISIFFRIILPISRPALATVAVLTFMGSWNDFFGPLLYLNKPELWTVQMGLYQFQTSVPGENAEQIWAATTVITAPLVLLYFLMQDQFMAAFANVRFK
ncbi:MAG: carbohydrate ABC transporter permease [Caldilineales bacterium]|nr:carbohydrate ABC transporter permease [Caldilineales bacterium]MCW5857833.1 carbohydrate ABC transporter permease [Caldilineales bacterium]